MGRWSSWCRSIVVLVPSLVACGGASSVEPPDSGAGGADGSGSGGGGGGRVIATCGHLDEIAWGEYFLQNNQWGKGELTEFDQCIERAYSAAFPAGWRWTWPASDTTQVRGYPFIGFGQDPWRPSSTSSKLPRRAAELGALSVTHEVRTQAEGFYNLAFDVWVTRSPGVTSPPEANVTREIMIWLDYGENPLPAFWFVEGVTLGGAAYDFYRGPAEPAGSYVRDYLAFLRKTPALSGVTPIHEFVAYLLERGHVLPDEYVRNVFFGNEVWHGTGETYLDAYAVTFE